MRTFVYVDGFNLYYGALKGTPWKWLDPVALLERVLQPNHRILTVKYFTARVSGTSADPSKPQRQNVYLRAMQHYRPEIKVYFGHFLSHRVRAPLAQPAGNRRTVEIIKTEEKGSDVNLAVHLLNDGWLNAYDCGVTGRKQRQRYSRSHASCAPAARQADRTGHPRRRKAVPAAYGACGLLTAHPGEWPAAFAIARSDPRHQHPKTRGLVAMRQNVDSVSFCF